MKEIITNSEKETIALGKKTAKKLKGGEVLALFGDLGAGKTTFIKGVAKGLGIKKVITSPTFVLMKPYDLTNKNSNKSNITRMVHIDCYRVNSHKAIEDIGAVEYFSDPNTIVVIEWPERIKKILPKDRIEISIKLGKKNNQRAFNFKDF